MSKLKSWRMVKPCADCPFSTKGPGLRLRRSLRPGRYRSILADLRRGAHFFCHKTTRGTGDGSNRVCAGSLAWSEKRGITSNYQRVCERVEHIFRKPSDE